LSPALTDSQSVTMSRRAVLGAGGVAGALTLGGHRLLGEAAEAAVSLPPPDSSGIEHIVVLTMESRSFDHFLGWLPHADGQQAGLTYVDRYRVPHQTHHLTDTSGCGFHDPDHSYEGGRIELNGGLCDGWLRAGRNDRMSIGYYEKADLEFLGQAASDWTTCDRYFASTMAESYPNRFYLHCAQTDRLHDGNAFSTMTTIWDRLAAKQVGATYYYADVPFAVLLGGHSPHHALVGNPANPAQGTFFAEAAAGTLPAVSYVDPHFLHEDAGTSADDHPHADIRAGEAFLNHVYDAVRNGPGWPGTVLVVTYADWGGFFDHVAPRHAEDVASRTSLRGFRVPTVVISPFASRHHVAHLRLDHASVLKMIEWRWGLKALTVRDYHANNLARVLDFTTTPPDLNAPGYTVTPFARRDGRCASQDAEPGVEARAWAGLKKIARQHGWDVGT
jgi:phospholipase C